jgi:hypothetical protein
VERKKSNPVAVDWSAYFKSIHTVCPWSLGLYLKGHIDIQQFRGYRITLDQPLLARIYITDLNLRELKKLAQAYDRLDALNEWFWSDPRHRDYSTPVQCLIQQNRKYLEEQRKKQGKKLISINNQSAR